MTSKTTLPVLPFLIFWILCLVLAVYVGSFTGCSETKVDTADQRQAKETSKALAEADRKVGMPDIVNYTERQLAKDILELRDQEITTYCYIVNWKGELVFIGEAIGFGLPYSVQFTNPEKLVDAEKQLGKNLIDYAGIMTLPQADPNGLFMPPGLSATWIMLKGPDKKVHPVYMEPEIVVSPFPLHQTSEAPITPEKVITGSEAAVITK